MTTLNTPLSGESGNVWKLYMSRHCTLSLEKPLFHILYISKSDGLCISSWLPHYCVAINNNQVALQISIYLCCEYACMLGGSLVLARFHESNLAGLFFASVVRCKSAGWRLKAEGCSRIGQLIFFPHGLTSSSWLVQALFLAAAGFLERKRTDTCKAS